MASGSNQPRLKVGQLVYLAVDRDGDTLNCEAVVANISGSRCLLALAGAAALDPGTGATVTSEALAAGEVPGVYETGRGPVCFLSSPCREVLVAPKKSWGSTTVDFELGIDIMSITRLWHRHNLGAEFLGHENNAADRNTKSEAKSKKSKKAKHTRTTLAVANSSGSQSAAESEDSNGGEELDGELGEALKEMAGLFQNGNGGKQAQRRQEKKSSKKKKTKSKGKQKKKKCEGSEDNASGPSSPSGSSSSSSSSSSSTAPQVKKKKVKKSAKASGSPSGVEKGARENAVQLAILRLVQEMYSKLQDGSGISEGSEGRLDGMRVVQALSKLRILKKRFHEDPGKIYEEYRAEWEESLGAEGKPWTWRDVSLQIQWNGHLSMRRMYVLFGTVLQQLKERKRKLAMAQTVQAMKSIHEFATTTKWELAWPLTFLPDPLRSKKHGGKEEEMEAILAYVRTQKELDSKTIGEGKSAKEELSGEEDRRGKKGRGRGRGRGEKAEEE